MASEPARRLSGTMDVHEFEAFLEGRPQQERWQLIQGNAVMMAPPNLVHQRIALNLRDLLTDGVRARGLDLFVYVDVGVRVPTAKNFQPQPDVLPGTAGCQLFGERFSFVAEVISPSNTRKEIGLKLRRYREAPDNLYVMIIEQRRVFAEVHARSRNWQPAAIRRADDLVELPELGLRCVLGALYWGTPLDPRIRVA
ncbi:MAG: Uma2 family endonuclease [Methylobacteriaceae bacterium]|nr:Uma2 family endonuclease [Methylobacteriaceae bacterium]